MPRATNSVARKKKHKKVLKQAKGYYGAASKLYRTAKPVSYTHLTLPTIYSV